MSEDNEIYKAYHPKKKDKGKSKPVIYRQLSLFDGDLKEKELKRPVNGRSKRTNYFS